LASPQPLSQGRGAKSENGFYLPPSPAGEGGRGMRPERNMKPWENFKLVYL